MKKPQTFKNSDSNTLYLMNQWIKFLESESFKCMPGYRVRWQQAKILREIFDIHES